jgi:hypothetical protein
MREQRSVTNTTGCESFLCDAHPDYVTGCGKRQRAFETGVGFTSKSVDSVPQCFDPHPPRVVQQAQQEPGPLAQRALGRSLVAPPARRVALSVLRQTYLFRQFGVLSPFPCPAPKPAASPGGCTHGQHGGCQAGATGHRQHRPVLAHVTALRGEVGSGHPR